MKISIIGSGAMGSGIAQIVATAGQEVSLIDTSDKILARATQNIQTSLLRFAEKGRLKESPQEILKRIIPLDDIARGVSDADFVIEAVFESIDLKKEIFAEIDLYAPKRAVLATNTSSLSITVISEATKRRQKVVGMHWMNPAPIMKVVEITKSRYTDDETVEATLDLCRLCQKEPIISQKDVWFFLTVRSKFGLSFEANLMYLNKEFNVKEIDAVIKYKLEVPMGEFELLDFTGAVDIRTGSLESTERILRSYPAFEPSPAFLSVFRYLTYELWKPMSQKGLNGVKSGKGFYTYPVAYAKPEIPRELATSFEPVQLMAPSINLAASCVSDGIGTVNDINKAFKLAYGWPKGIFEYINEYGTSAIIAVLRDKKKKAPDWLKGLYKPSTLITSWK